MLFHVGQRVQAGAAIEYVPYAVIAAKERGTVTLCFDVDGFTGIDVRWDVVHSGLVTMENTTTLVSPELDNVLPALERRRSTPGLASLSG